MLLLLFMLFPTLIKLLASHTFVIIITMKFMLRNLMFVALKVICVRPSEVEVKSIAVSDHAP